MTNVQGVVLVVDDHDLSRATMAEFLEALGYGVVQARSGDEALERLVEGRADVAILDLYMPGLSGLEVVRAAQESQESARTPIIVLTGSLDADDEMRSIEAGAFAFLSKPCPPSRLEAWVAAAMRRAVVRAEAADAARRAAAEQAALEGRVHELATRIAELERDRSELEDTTRLLRRDVHRRPQPTRCRGCERLRSAGLELARTREWLVARIEAEAQRARAADAQPVADALDRARRLVEMSALRLQTRTFSEHAPVRVHSVPELLADARIWAAARHAPAEELIRIAGDGEVSTQCRSPELVAALGTLLEECSRVAAPGSSVSVSAERIHDHAVVRIVAHPAPGTGAGADDAPWTPGADGPAGHPGALGGALALAHEVLRALSGTVGARRSGDALEVALELPLVDPSPIALSV